MTPRARRVVDVGLDVAGCSHISVCMAGAISTGRPGSEEHVGEQVVGAVRWPARAEQVGRRRRDDDQVGVPPECDVWNLVGIGPHIEVATGR